jgi:ABC-type Zn uptake system ZnuABC Zn-binding protein ZnuA
VQVEGLDKDAPLKRIAALILATLALALLSAACSGDDAKSSSSATSSPAASGGGSEKLKVVTTVAPLTNIVKNIGGDRIELEGIIPDGVDSHTFEPSAGDAVTLSKADIFIMNGAHLEGSSEKIAEENLPDPTKIYHLADKTLNGDDEASGFLYDFSFPRSGGDPNPHLWMNPKYAEHYAELIEGWLSDNDTANASYYQGNLAAFKQRIDQLDQAIRTAVATVPEKNRKLLTYHDSWAYWAREYGWTVIGAIQPSDFSEPSAQDVASLIDQIKAESLPAIFGSEVFPSAVTQQIASETGATYVTQLSDDEPPGDVGAPEHTYIGMLVFDMREMIPPLGGSAAAFDNFPVENTYTKD